MRLTAVEWLVEQLFWSEQMERIERVVQQAKEMEKEQIIDAHNQGYADGYRDNGNESIDYYNETYSGDNEETS